MLITMERRLKHGTGSTADGGKVNYALFSWRVWAVVGVAALILALAFRFKGSGSSAESQEQSTDEPTMQAATPSQTADPSEPQEVSELAIESPLQADMQPDQAVADALSETPSVEPVELMLDPQQLVASLARLDLSEGKITRQQAGHWKQQLAALVDHGAAAVPAIREFLAQNQEVSFDATSGGEFLGQPSLRAAFFDALQQIGGEAALAVSLEVLQTTGALSEIALLARYVEQQSTG